MKCSAEKGKDPNCYFPQKNSRVICACTCSDQFIATTQHKNRQMTFTFWMRLRSEEQPGRRVRIQILVSYWCSWGNGLLFCCCALSFWCYSSLLDHQVSSFIVVSFKCSMWSNNFSHNVNEEETKMDCPLKCNNDVHDVSFRSNFLLSARDTLVPFSWYRASNMMLKLMTVMMIGWSNDNAKKMVHSKDSFMDIITRRHNSYLWYHLSHHCGKRLEWKAVFHSILIEHNSEAKTCECEK